MPLRYVIIRDDDTNALTPIDCLETIYRPFLDHNLPVSLAVIPCVDTRICRTTGEAECYLPNPTTALADRIPIGKNPKLVHYLSSTAYELAMHGCYHTQNEFDMQDRAQVIQCIETGFKHFLEAGLQKPTAFVAPYEAISKVAFSELVKQFATLSSNWYSLKKVPYAFWPALTLKKLSGNQHWRAAHCLCLSRPQQFFSSIPYTLDEIIEYIENNQLTILLTHWWEFFDNEGARKKALLHELARYLAASPTIKVVTLNRNPLTLL